MSHWIKMVCIVLVGLVSILGGYNIGFADALEVGAGKKYESIQDAVDSAGSGDTIIVSDGIYQESITVDVSNLTIQSVNESGAVMDGKSGAFGSAIKVDRVDNVQIIGLKFQNYNTDKDDWGVVYLRDSNKSQVKYCYFTNNTIDKANMGCIAIRSGDNVIVRGNTFNGNKIHNESRSSLTSWNGASDCIIELNKFLDKPTGKNSRNVYWTNNGHKMIFRYNLVKDYTRFRQGVKFDLRHNIFDLSSASTKAIEFHDQTNPEHYDADDGASRADEKHIFRNNTVKGGVIRIVRTDSADFQYNLFISPVGGTAIVEAWDGDASGNTLSNNKLDNVKALTDLNDAYTASNNTPCTSSYNSSTGAHKCDQKTYGADLNIGVWPFTKQDGTALVDDYPYIAGDYNQESKKVELKIPPPPSELNISG